MEKQSQIGHRTLVGKGELTLRDPKVMFDEPQDTAKVMPDVVYMSYRRVSGNHQQRNADPVLVVALGQRQNGRLLMIVPTAPVVPRDEDGCVVPIDFIVGASPDSFRWH